MNYERKAKVFSRLALKEKISLLHKIKSLKTVSNELENMAALSRKLEDLANEEIKKEAPQNASQLKASKFYSQKIHNELSQISNRREFLEKEAISIKLGAGQAKTKVNKALDKSSVYHKLQKIELENKS